MTSSIHDFVSPIVPINNLSIQGIGGKLQFIGNGSIPWKSKDDQGVQHGIIITNILYVKHLPYRLLSPQHWGQVSNDYSTNKNGIKCFTISNEIIIQ